MRDAASFAPERPPAASARESTLLSYAGTPVPLIRPGRRPRLRAMPSAARSCRRLPRPWRGNHLYRCRVGADMTTKPQTLE